MVAILPSLLAYAALAAASAAADRPAPRAVDKLDDAATAEAQQRDDNATRAFSDVQIKTSDGRCLFVDKLSGDFRENLTPIQVGTCGATGGQGWDIITSGKHNNAANSMLVVSTLTQACFNFDPRRAGGNQVLLFSCGGRADGGGEVTNSQLFTFGGGAGPLSFQPENEQGSCFTVNGNVLDIAKCNAGDAKQSFTFGRAAAADGGNGNGNGNGNGDGSGDSNTQTTAAADTQNTATADTQNTATADAQNTATAETQGTATADTQSTTAVNAQTTAAPKATTCPAKPRKNRLRKNKSKCNQRTRTVTLPGVAAGAASFDPADLLPASTAAPEAATTAAAGGGGAIATASPTTPVPVSGARGTLDPTAAAEANRRDGTATRAFSNVEIRAPNGQCLSIDPTAGDFRQNLIPVGLVDCAGTPNEKWDVISAGVHNDRPESALIVSTLTQGCISFDGRRQPGDTVTLFSCGGRADGSGETNTGQLMPFIGALSFAFAPESENGKTCILPGDAGRLDSGPCPKELGPELFSIFPD